MAREKYEIKDSILSQLQGLGLSESATAIWNWIVDAVVSAIYNFELIIDIFKADIEDKIAKKRLGSLDWYIQKSKEFQLGDDIVFFEDGQIGYAAIDENKQIIAFATASEANDIVKVKIAKLVNQELAPLTSEEQLQFTNYMEKIMLAGTKMETVSLLPDSIKVIADIYYDPIYSSADIQGFLDVALFDYKTNKQDTVFNRNDFIEILRNVTGIKDVNITTLQGIQGTNVTDIVREYEIVAGYFNWDSSNTYNLIAS